MAHLGFSVAVLVSIKCKACLAKQSRAVGKLPRASRAQKTKTFDSKIFEPHLSSTHTHPLTYPVVKNGLQGRR